MRLDDDASETITDTLEQNSAATASRLIREALDRRFDELVEFEDRNTELTILGQTFFQHLSELRKDAAHA